MKTSRKTLVVEAALAGLFAAAVASPAFADHHEKGGKGKGEEAKSEAKDHGKAHAKPKKGAVPCYGVNACKGTSECSVTGKHGCAGQNECKGQGFISLAKKTCLKNKGSLTEIASEAPKTEAAPIASPAPKK